MNDITFGTDGWRGIMADDFTFPNVKIVAQAIANYVNEIQIASRGVVIGYDNRFLSPEFAKVCCDILTANGIKVYMTDGATPTPVTAFCVVHEKAAGAIMITASHNPSTHNGIKFIPEYGGPANKGITDKIVHNVQNIQKTNEIKTKRNESLVEHINLKNEYKQYILKLIDVEVFKKNPLKIVVNPMFGAGIGYTEEILAELGCEVETINNHRDPLFGGSMPEPTMANMQDLIQTMKLKSANLGLANDGDADRFGVIDDSGNYISPNEVIYLLAHYLINDRGYKSPIARTVATTFMVNRIADKHGLKVIETPVGFKYIAEGLMHEGAFIGGEESGGLTIKGAVPEKDGILACLLIAEMCAKYGKNPTQIMEDLKEQYGYLYSGRIDIHTTNEQKQEILNRLQSYNPSKIAEKKVSNKINIDGIKFVMEDGSWTLVRASGTEALFRIYAEGNTKEQRDQIHNQVKQDLGL